ncbi:MAG TPA: fumarylacetoacetate hydrolase family protein [Sedimentisphaerales bacterium]|nr:fumarylacetoacetate hydrolase family protein [Sedimentisphaerales bacterium]
MILTKHQCEDVERWALDGLLLSPEFDFRRLCGMHPTEVRPYLTSLQTDERATGQAMAPMEYDQEVWACGVTYARSRDAREAETDVKNVYDMVYEAKRPELFFKAIGWRVKGPQSAIRIRRDSHWNVPEPELTLLVNRHGEILGYCVGNDVSSRNIEGENPLYLPQAKMYDGSCAIGPGICIAEADSMRNLPIALEIERKGEVIFTGDANTSQIRRSFEELVFYLTREMTFPFGAFLMTGTGIIPEQTFSLSVGDKVRITIGALVLENRVES